MTYQRIDIKAKERLYSEIGELMQGHAFVADIPYWHLKSDETITSLFIENYHSSFLFYISIGVYVIGLNKRKIGNPKIRDMHAWTRLSQLTPITTQPQIALIGDGNQDANRIVDEVLNAIRNVGVAVLQELTSLVGTKRVLCKYGDMRWQIEPVLRGKLFGSDSFKVRGELPIQEWEIAGSVDPYQK